MTGANGHNGHDGAGASLPAFVLPVRQPGAGPEPAACIIPAFEEASRVGDVVRVVIGSQLFAEVLVVDDGSTDETVAEARSAGALVKVHEENQGKAAALRTGLENTVSPIVCFLDADLVGITAEHLQTLLEPVSSGREAATIAVFRGGRGPTTLAQQISPMISGQRCLRRELMEGFSGWDSGYGIETAINAHLKDQGVEPVFVEWYGASHIMKEEKRGLIKGAASRVRMFSEIAVAWIRSRIGRRPDL